MRLIETSVASAVLAAGLLVTPAGAQGPDVPNPTPSPAPQASPAPQVLVTCSSKPGERIQCPADTSSGVVLARSAGAAPCLLGKTWGYDNEGIWVADGCTGVFVVAAGLPEGVAAAVTK